MRVDPNLLTPAVAAAGRRPASRESFAPSGADCSPRTAGPVASAPLATMDALLAIQGQAEEPGERRRRSVKRGQDLLSALDGLKAGLLGGRLSPRDLRALAGRLADASAASGDPGLDDVIAHIELRAQVELAKLGAAAGV